MISYTLSHIGYKRCESSSNPPYHLLQVLAFSSKCLEKKKIEQNQVTTHTKDGDRACRNDFVPCRNSDHKKDEVLCQENSKIHQTNCCSEVLELESQVSEVDVECRVAGDVISLHLLCIVTPQVSNGLL